MNLYLLSSNVVTWSLQMGVLVAVAAVVPLITGLKTSKARLIYWQLVLVACLLLPAIHSWKQPVTGKVVAATYSLVVLPAGEHPTPTPFPWMELIPLLLATGIVLRLLWLSIGFYRLTRHRAHSRRLVPESSWGAEADIRVSHEIASPVTFGYRRPVVLLPLSFPDLEESAREAILCHEVLHIRRKDWLFTMGEEVIRAVLWFHPCIWWLLGEVQLTREQVVDREVIEMTKSRDEYVDALLSMASAPPRLDLAPAPLFLRKRHLKQRVVSILKEVRMSRTRTVSALAAGVLMLGASCWLITGALPLQAAPQQGVPNAGVTVDTHGAELLHRTPVIYPPAAADKGIGGSVVLQVKLDDKGNVSDASVVSGPDELRSAALKSVLNWHFTKDAAQGVRQVNVVFDPQHAPHRVTLTAPPAPPAPLAAAQPVVLRNISVFGLSDTQKAQLMNQLGDAGITEGKSFDNAETMRLNAQTVANAYDEHVRVGLLRSASVGEAGLSLVIPESGTTGTVSFPVQFVPRDVPAGAQRVGANIMQSKLVAQEPPAYPPLAKAARVQGTVKFEITIGKDGSVTNLQLISGPPLLVKAASDAVSKWVYNPTLLNGNPVDVVTTVDINFTLSQ